MPQSGLFSGNRKYTEKELRVLKEKIAVLTSGGDAQGMNAAIRGVYGRAVECGYEPYGIRNGFAGLLRGDIVPLSAQDVRYIASKGGTILGTARCEEFKREEMQKYAADICRENRISAVIVIGGDGSYRGACSLYRQGIGVVGIPGTIDLDIGCTEYTIGFDTAVNHAMNAIDWITDTSEAHSCFSVVEVMGRRAGFIALWSGIGSSARAIMADCTASSEDIICHLRKCGFTSGTIVLAEGAGRAAEVADAIEKSMNVHTRINVLGFLQRGGAPTAKDRVCGSMMGSFAVDLIREKKIHHLVCMKNDRLVGVGIEEGLRQTKSYPEHICELGATLSRI